MIYLKKFEQLDLDDIVPNSFLNKYKKESESKKDISIIDDLYYYYFTKLANLRIGDTVIYKKDRHKYNNCEFIYNGIRKDDNKMILKHDNDKIFYATKERVFKKDILTDDDKMNKFKKVLYFMVENGDLSKVEVDNFIDDKINDPWGEEK